MSHPPEPTTQRASSGDLSLLCQSCGLCCDGSLFGRVDLEAHEVEGARKRGLHVVAGGRSFEQPCSALAVAASGPGDHRGCSLYEDRPQSCRRFACRLYEKYRLEGGPVDEPLSVVRRVRSLLGRVLGPRKTNLAKTERDELARVLEESFARAEQH
jgi:hypothetical protein